MLPFSLNLFYGGGGGGVGGVTFLFLRNCSVFYDFDYFWVNFGGLLR